MLTVGVTSVPGYAVTALPRTLMMASASPQRSFGTGASFCTDSAPASYHAKPLSTNTSYDDVYPCGPIPSKIPEIFAVPASGQHVGFFESSGSDAGFQCVELANRYLWVADGLQPISGKLLDGYNYVDTEVSGTHPNLPVSDRVYNRDESRLHVPYLPGDVVSFSGNGGSGHVAIVIKSGYTKTSRGTYQVVLMEEDASSTGQTTVWVKDWKLQTPPGTSVAPYNFLKLPAPWAAMRAPVPKDADPTGPSPQISSVTCPTSAKCIAVGTYNRSVGTSGLVLTDSNGSWTSAEISDPAGNGADVSLDAVTCPSASSCIAVGNYYSGVGRYPLIVTLTGSKWTAHEIGLPSNADPSAGSELDAVACSSSIMCVAVGVYSTQESFLGLIVSGSGSSWSYSEAPLPGSAGLTSMGSSLDDVACKSACAAAGYYLDSSDAMHGFLLTSNGSSWIPAKAPLPPQAADASLISLMSAACPSATRCEIVGSDSGSASPGGLIESGLSNTWKPTDAPVPSQAGTASLTQITCPSSTRCVAVGTYTGGSPASPHVLVEAGIGATWRQSVVALPTDSGYGPGSGPSVACSSVAMCVAVGIYNIGGGGNNYSWLIATASGPWKSVPVPLPADINSARQSTLNAATCAPAAPQCVAVGSYIDTSGQMQGLLLTGPP